MKVFPGDLLVLRFIGLVREPVRTYLVVSRVLLTGSESNDNTAFCYLKEGECRIRQTSMSALKRAHEEGDIEIVEVVRAKKCIVAT